MKSPAPNGGAIKVEQTQKIDARQLDPEQRDLLKKILLSSERGENE